MFRFITLAIFFTLSLLRTVNAQDYITENKDLFLLRDSSDLVPYFKSIKILADSAYARKDQSRLSVLGDYVKESYDSLSSVERNALRIAAMQVAFRTNKLSGNYNEALSIYLVAHQNVEDRNILDTNAWFIESEIFNIYTIKGDFEKSDYYGNLLEQSLKHFNKTALLSRYYTNKGINFKSRYKIEEAIEIFERGMEIADSIKYPTGIFANAYNIAVLYNEWPDKGSSEIYLQKAIEILPEIKSDRKYLEKKAALEIELGKYNFLKKNYIESINHFEEGISLSEQFYLSLKRREIAAYYSSLASAYLQLDSIEKAEVCIGHGFRCLIADFTQDDEPPGLTQLFPENAFIPLLKLKSEIHRKQYDFSDDIKDLEKAIKYIDLAFYVNDWIRETAIADDSKLVAIRGNKELIQIGVAILYDLYKTTLKEEYLEGARIFFNRSKSLLYNEKSRSNIITSLLTSQDKESLDKLKKNLLSLHEKKFETGANINAINGEILICQEKIDMVLSKYKEISIPIQQPENYIEYYISDDMVYVLAQLENINSFVIIGENQKFEKLARRLNDYILLKGNSLDNEILNEMYSFLLKPVTSKLPSRFVVIPDGIIGFIPFEMLKDEDDKFLLESSTISYSFEYFTYVTAVDSHDLEAYNKVFDIFCLAPQYKVKELPNQNELVRGGIYHLPYAKLEVDSISKIFEGRTFVSESSDKEEWETNVTGSTIFHYAGHAIIKGDKSFLALTDDFEEVKQITSKEISLMYHPLDLVVLSACETGLGKLEVGEGIRSLGRSFMEAGVRSTVISLWNVNDKSTSLIMTGFYKYLKQGLRKDEALRSSKLDYLKNATKQFKHPYFWAAFIPAGDMDELK